jgi:hypothetical protein
MPNSSVVTSADYAEALLSARRARDVLIALLLIILLFQIGLFFAARYKIAIDGTSKWIDVLRYFVGLTDFLGVVLPFVLGVVLLLISLVMLIGRLLGISHLVSSFVACVVLAALLFPWQAFLMYQWPGVLYTWSELLLRVRDHPQGINLQCLYWARFVGWPIAALAILAKIYLRSARGLRLALYAPSAPMVEMSASPPGNVP